ncbi:Bromodomain-containing protein [Cantharellus anzutake]|uniref:Bromodomain-containing protein n=1 Tax=Cantharellus anzutake TaxID=1750568 RepID=UPI001904C24C|nr:Bromodomain-containing protein [Cantharellus anzutake]KAF8331076.1 Bromodomain-containing protein [Cantharellus anzutake]
MPREYITRLVFDRNAEAMAVVQKGLKVVGGIAYRPFPHRTFAEIVFFAISGVYQINGYGGHLMNQFKSYMKKNMPEIKHFLTYADNYAIGYFKKQGFTREITLPKHLWMGYIKDYEGGTLMQCTMLPKVDYLEARGMLQSQKEAILTKIRQLSKSHIIYKGLDVFRNAPEGFKIHHKDVPGLCESGWTPEMDATLLRPVRNADHTAMRKLLSELQGHADAWPFLLPVNKNEVTDYYDVIKNPMDFSTMEKKLENGGYADFDSFVADAQLIFSNCRVYNSENSGYAKRANRMEKFMKEYLTKAGRG